MLTNDQLPSACLQLYLNLRCKTKSVLLSSCLSFPQGCGIHLGDQCRPSTQCNGQLPGGQEVLLSLDNHLTSGLCTLWFRHSLQNYPLEKIFMKGVITKHPQPA